MNLQIGQDPSEDFMAGFGRSVDAENRHVGMANNARPNDEERVSLVTMVSLKGERVREDTDRTNCTNVIAGS